MRVVAEIPHPQFSISIFSWNGKYILKIEIGQFEQVYKVSELDVNGLDDVKAMVTEEFLKNVMLRFIAMRSDFAKSFKAINS